MSDTSFTSPHQLLRCRLLNLDGAGLVRERVGQRAILDLHAWFLSPRGADRGAKLLKSAPLLDTVIERGARLLGESAKPDLRFAAFANFGAGLTLGSVLLKQREGDAPFGVELSLHEATGMLAACDLVLHVSPAPEGGLPPHLATLELVGMDPELDAVLEAASRLALLGCTPEAGITPLRFLFYLGLIGAGIAPRTRPLPSRRRSNPGGQHSIEIEQQELFE